MKKRWLFLFTLCLVCVLALAGCGGQDTTSPTTDNPTDGEEQQATVDTEPVELLVSAAASMTDCLTELQTMYTEDHSNVTITYNFGSSGSLQQQIEQGAPANIFLSAGQKQMQALVDKDLMVNDSVKDIVENKVVLVVPKDADPLTFDDLTTDKISKLAVGEFQSVPVGQYSEEIFNNMGISDEIADKLVFAKDVREVLSWVETGNAEAGIVYATDALISDAVQVSDTAPEDSHSPVIYPVGVVKDGKLETQAQAFVDFLFSDEASEVFTKYGFTPLGK